ncbi:hypothetical protein SCLCIDRAFT_1044674 [Scleroderma citrinum Foug A]|uniref:Uncharacterized protein n=1 Tax=Scleroderma citrinum Foug A TaxID=1036808 RepID=A0A0C3DE25_9AGAM|nr:hypothetical protein SCLCIDRAFT_1044674 [Scleroderma citrinum Foug A]
MTPCRIQLIESCLGIPARVSSVFSSDSLAPFLNRAVVIIRMSHVHSCTARSSAVIMIRPSRRL